MNLCTDVIDAEPKTGQKNALCIMTPEQEYFIRGDNKEIINGYGQSSEAKRLQLTTGSPNTNVWDLDAGNKDGTVVVYLKSGCGQLYTALERSLALLHAILWVT